MPWYYWPAYEMTNFSSTKALQSPVKIDAATPTNVMFSENLHYRGDTGLYGSTQTDAQNVTQISAHFFISPKPLGTYAATYDGAVRMRYWQDFLPASSSSIWVQYDAFGGKLANLQR